MKNKNENEKMVAAFPPLPHTHKQTNKRKKENVMYSNLPPRLVPPPHTHTYIHITHTTKTKAKNKEAL